MPADRDATRSPRVWGAPGTKRVEQKPMNARDVTSSFLPHPAPQPPVQAARTPEAVDALVAENGMLTRRVLALKRELAEAQRIASHDALTGLPNRRLLPDTLSHALASARRTDRRVAVLMVDVDRFKDINDRHGHSVGDAVLQEVARRLTGAVRASDTSWRVGGDEFVVVLADLSAANGVDAAVAKIGAALSGVYRIDGGPLEVTASIGVAVFPDDGTDGRQLIECADRAMYRDKARLDTLRRPPCTDRGTGAGDRPEPPYADRAT